MCEWILDCYPTEPGCELDGVRYLPTKRHLAFEQHWPAHTQLVRAAPRSGKSSFITSLIRKEGHEHRWILLFSHSSHQFTVISHNKRGVVVEAEEDTTKISRIVRELVKQETSPLWVIIDNEQFFRETDLGPKLSALSLNNEIRFMGFAGSSPDNDHIRFRTDKFYGGTRSALGTSFLRLDPAERGKGDEVEQVLRGCAWDLSGGIAGHFTTVLDVLQRHHNECRPTAMHRDKTWTLNVKACFPEMMEKLKKFESEGDRSIVGLDFPKSTEMVEVLDTLCIGPPCMKYVVNNTNLDWEKPSVYTGDETNRPSLGVGTENGMFRTLLVNGIAEITQVVGDCDKFVIRTPSKLVWMLLRHLRKGALETKTTEFERKVTNNPPPVLGVCFVASLLSRLGNQVLNPQAEKKGAGGEVQEKTVQAAIEAPLVALTHSKLIKPETAESVVHGLLDFYVDSDWDLGLEVMTGADFYEMLEHYTRFFKGRAQWAHSKTKNHQTADYSNINRGLLLISTVDRQNLAYTGSGADQQSHYDACVDFARSSNSFHIQQGQDKHVIIVLYHWQSRELLIPMSNDDGTPDPLPKLVAEFSPSKRLGHYTGAIPHCTNHDLQYNLSNYKKHYLLYQSESGQFQWQPEQQEMYLEQQVSAVTVKRTQDDHDEHQVKKQKTGPNIHLDEDGNDTLRNVQFPISVSELKEQVVQYYNTFHPTIFKEHVEVKQDGKLLQKGKEVVENACKLVVRITK
eukprot:TRINITY_DN67543_c0_g5_i1.p1 TRINITY_DN67543_c0_g5~~TRINITY_DN67543_c0_g5_i1.p1  ORF type:complete len:738 (+),score=45.51 TRINITY_DN67543_c0_g5_i1:86-2299(+)